VKIKNFEGKSETLSDETYTILRWGRGIDIPSNYPVGTKVRLISGVDGNPNPGYHFSEGFCTICRVDAETAEYLGIKIKYLSPKPKVVKPCSRPRENCGW
jgi:hypothetical protein